MSLNTISFMLTFLIKQLERAIANKEKEIIRTRGRIYNLQCRVSSNETMTRKAKDIKNTLEKIKF